MSRLLIVEDEPNLAQGLKFNLEIEGYHTDVCEMAEDALPRFGEYEVKSYREEGVNKEI